MTGPVLEICVDELASVEAAVTGGADRIEMCAALALGGLTPSPAFVRQTVTLTQSASIAAHAIVRPRAGNFAYGVRELRLAIDEAMGLLDAGVDGLVFGATRDDALDSAALSQWVAAVRAARPGVALTLHRAIDTVADPIAAVAVAIDSGFDRILTSGGARDASSGSATIARMVAAAGERLVVMAGAGVSPGNVADLIAATGVREVHASASAHVVDADPRVDALGFATPPRRRTDPETVRALRDALHGMRA